MHLSPEAEPDDELLRKVARGDRAAFAVVFDRHASAALRYARNLVRDPSTSEDLVHAAFVRLLESASSGGIDPARGTIRGLLFRTVRNLGIDWLRARKPDVSLEDREVDDGSKGVAGVRLELEAALSIMPEAQRSALLLRVDAGLSYSEIAAALGGSLAQVKNWIFRARRALAERMLEPDRAKEVGRVV